mmetsp:Transcript_36829/g.86361  ORF Transcript_36829/g.86361 Transcript_36829/m.86361 type:complete len:802 (-) Transcript_36829:63-2468(-)
MVTVAFATILALTAVARGSECEQAADDVDDLISGSSHLYLLQARATLISEESLAFRPLHHHQHQSHNFSNLSVEVLTEAEAQAFPWRQPNTSAADMVGVTANSAGDLDCLLIAIGGSVATLALGSIFHGFIRSRVPMIYNYPELMGHVPKWQEGRDQSFFGMFADSYRLSLDEIAQHVNLDRAMLIEYTHLAMKIMLIIGIPNLLGLSPVYALAGGGYAGPDKLSRPAMANVLPHRWLFWTTPAVVWFVVVATQMCVFHAMRMFVKRRAQWLKGMPAPEGTTILVENIPHEHRQDSALAEYFNKTFERKVVARAYVVKKCRRLQSLVRKLNSASESLKKAEEAYRRTGESSRVLDYSNSILGEYVDEVQYYEKKVLSLQADRNAEREKVLQEAEEGSRQVNCSGGFVTFFTKLDREIALNLAYTPDDGEFATSVPPDPDDVIYEDLQGERETKFFRMCLGVACLVGIFFAFMPVVLTISSVASLENLRKVAPGTMECIARVPFLLEMWDGVVASIALSLVTSFLPSIILAIFRAFFVLRGQHFAQWQMQRWYYHFLVVFVLLVTAVGESLVRSWLDLVESPTGISRTLAESLPCATHFYMEYVAIAWSAHATLWTRITPLIKYWLFRFAFSAQDARERAEPEDLNFNGMGSMSARFSVILAMGIVYSTLAPIMTLLCMLHFLICRLIYAYLFVFCQEREKADLGGRFFVTQLNHIQQAVLIYILLMVGVLEAEAVNIGPAVLAGSSLIYWAYTVYQFNHIFRWQSLSVEALHDETVTHQRDSRGQYMQPELIASKSDSTEG